MFKQKEFEDSIQFQESTNNLLQAMNSLGCFKDKEKLKRELLKAEHNTGWLNDNNLSCNDGDDNDNGWTWPPHGTPMYLAFTIYLCASLPIERFCKVLSTLTLRKDTHIF